MVGPRACRADADAPLGARKYGILHATSMGVAAPRRNDSNPRVAEVTRGMASSARFGQVHDWGVEGGYRREGVTRSQLRPGRWLPVGTPSPTEPASPWVLQRLLPLSTVQPPITTVARTTRAMDRHGVLIRAYDMVSWPWVTG